MKIILVSRSLNNLPDNEKTAAELEKFFGPKFTFLLTFPEEAKYKVSEIKKLTTKLARKSTGLDKENVYVLMHSDGMSAICQNALLKTLEDSNHSIILVVKNADSLLPTIKSRCITEYVEVSEVQSVQNEYSVAEYDDITSLAKVERDKVRTMLEQMATQLLDHDLHKVIVIEEAMRKVDANCKIESILYEMVWKLKQQ